MMNATETLCLARCRTAASIEMLRAAALVDALARTEQLVAPGDGAPGAPCYTPAGHALHDAGLALVRRHGLRS